MLSCPNYTGASRRVKQPDYTALYRYLTGTGAHNFRDSVTLGFLAAYGHTPFDLGALPLAVDNVNHNPHLLPGKNSSVVRPSVGSKQLAAFLYTHTGTRCPT
jgi:hypothetical protein